MSDPFWLAKRLVPNPFAKQKKPQRRPRGRRGAAAPAPQRSHARKAFGTGLGVLFLACVAAVGHSLGKGTADSTLFLALAMLGGLTWLVRR